MKLAVLLVFMFFAPIQHGLFLWVFGHTLIVATLSGSELYRSLEVAHPVTDPSYGHLKVDKFAVD